MPYPSKDIDYFMFDRMPAPPSAGAVRSARSAIGQFVDALQNRRRGTSKFSLRMRVNGRSVWFGRVSLSDGGFQGYKLLSEGNIDTTPVFISHDAVDDWAFTYLGRLVGGWSLRELSPKKREAAGCQYNFVIDETSRTGVRERLCDAIGERDLAKCEELLRSSVDLNEPVLVAVYVGCWTLESRPILSYAMKEGFTDVVPALLREGADPNCFDEYGLTPLQKCASKNLKGIASLLIEHGADVLAFQKSESNTATAFSYCLMSDSPAFATLLIDSCKHQEIDVRLLFGKDELISCQVKSVSMAKVLDQHSFPWLSRDSAGTTPVEALISRVNFDLEKSPGLFEWYLQHRERTVPVDLDLCRYIRSYSTLRTKRDIFLEILRRSGAR